jgi:hypothetical protein
MINYGTADHSMAEDALQTLVDKGAIPKSILEEDEHGKKSKEYYQKLSVLQTRIADAGIESQKAHSRMLFLMRRIRLDFPATFPEKFELEQRQTQLLVKYSQKAIFGMSLEELHAKSFDPAYDSRTPEGQANIHAFIKEKLGSHAEVVASHREVESEIIERYALEQSYNKQIAELEGEVVAISEKHRKAAERVEQLEAEKRQHGEKLHADKLAETQRLLKELQDHEKTINHRRGQITQLHAEKADTVHKRNTLQVQIPQ